MEPTNTTSKWLNREVWQVIREFFAYILVAYFIYQNKELDREKTEILKVQIEVLSKTKETEAKQLQIIDKILNEKSSRYNNSEPFSHNSRE